ncbi:hypothetical protein CRG98_004391 [Punica granatum]|uniref:Uncharacterized protein n=1 Tax=Punica granatum TaxID=22663 RepID=A0A2I0L3N8_PUNGR|nr:hypothetical protein CRG98_004391 [Punica granatum]
MISGLPKKRQRIPQLQGIILTLVLLVVGMMVMKKLEPQPPPPAAEPHKLASPPQLHHILLPLPRLSLFLSGQLSRWSFLVCELLIIRLSVSPGRVPHGCFTFSEPFPKCSTSRPAHHWALPGGVPSSRSSHEGRLGPGSDLAKEKVSQEG